MGKGSGAVSAFGVAAMGLALQEGGAGLRSKRALGGGQGEVKTGGAETPASSTTARGGRWGPGGPPRLCSASLVLQPDGLGRAQGSRGDGQRSAQR